MIKRKPQEKIIEHRIIIIIIIGILISIISLSTSIKALKEKKVKPAVKVSEKNKPIIKKDIRKIIEEQIEVLNTIPAYVYQEEVKISELEEKEKAYSILYTLYNKNEGKNIDEETYNRLFLNEELDITNYKYIEKEKIKEYYKYIYNKDIEDINIELDGNTCPYFMLDEDKYYYKTNCLPTEKIIYYIYYYNESQNSITIKIALGFLKLDEDNKYYLHSFINPSIKDGRNIINDINYEEYMKYKILLHKKKSSYYIRKIIKENEDVKENQ